jgi:hypothetical protein
MATTTVAAPQHNTFTNLLHHGDCIEIMRRIPASSVDFILTDPPYLVNYRDRSGRTIHNDVDDSWLKPAMMEAISTPIYLRPARSAAQVLPLPAKGSRTVSL